MIYGEQICPAVLLPRGKIFKEEIPTMAIMRKKVSMDGNQAAATVSYAFTEVAGIYPITPSSPMNDHYQNGCYKASFHHFVLDL